MSWAHVILMSDWLIWASNRKLLHDARNGIEQLHQQDTLMLERNLAENWRRWKQCYTIYNMADDKTVASEEIKCVIFFTLLDTTSWTLQTANCQWRRWWQKAGQATGEIWSLLHSMLKHHIEVTHIQHPKPNNQVRPLTDECVTDLHSKAKTCEFRDLTEGLPRDCIMCAIINDKIQSRLLKKADLTLKDILDIHVYHKLMKLCPLKWLKIELATATFTDLKKPNSTRPVKKYSLSSISVLQ